LDGAERFVIVQEFLDLGLHRIAPLLGADLANTFVLTRGVDGLPTFPLRVRQRFFNVNILARLHGPNRCQAMPVVAGGDNHRVDIRIIDQFAKIRVGLCLGKTFGRQSDDLRIDVADCDDIDTFELTELAHQVAPTPSATDDAQTDRFVRHRVRRTSGKRGGYSGRCCKKTSPTEVLVTTDVLGWIGHGRLRMELSVDLGIASDQVRRL
jgi:hypothetical protein